MEHQVVHAHLGLPLQPPQRLRVHVAHVPEEGDPRAPVTCGGGEGAGPEEVRPANLAPDMISSKEGNYIYVNFQK